MKSIKALQEIADFDHPFIVSEDGTVSHAKGYWAPEVYNDDDDDIQIMSAYWEALTGYTGQYGYHGAVMHSSEFIGGGLARDILNNPGVYVVVAVQDLDDDNNVAGWAILRYVGKD